MHQRTLTRLKTIPWREILPHIATEALRWLAIVAAVYAGYLMANASWRNLVLFLASLGVAFAAPKVRDLMQKLYVEKEA